MDILLSVPVAIDTNLPVLAASIAQVHPEWRDAARHSAVYGADLQRDAAERSRVLAAIATALAKVPATGRLGLNYQRLGDGGAAILGASLQALPPHPDALAAASEAAEFQEDEEIASSVGLNLLPKVPSRAARSGQMYLKEVYLHQNGITAVGLDAILLGLQNILAEIQLVDRRLGIDKLYFGDNPLGDRGVVSIASSTLMRIVKELSISSTGCGDAGMLALALAMKSEEVDLGVAQQLIPCLSEADAELLAGMPHGGGDCEDGETARGSSIEVLVCANNPRIDMIGWSAIEAVPREYSGDALKIVGKPPHSPGAPLWDSESWFYWSYEETNNAGEDLAECVRKYGTGGSTGNGMATELVYNDETRSDGCSWLLSVSKIPARAHIPPEQMTATLYEEMEHTHKRHGLPPKQDGYFLQCENPEHGAYTLAVTADTDQRPDVRHKAREYYTNTVRTFRKKYKQSQWKVTLWQGDAEVDRACPAEQ